MNKHNLLTIEEKLRLNPHLLRNNPSRLKKFHFPDCSTEEIFFVLRKLRDEKRKTGEFTNIYYGKKRRAFEAKKQAENAKLPPEFTQPPLPDTAPAAENKPTENTSPKESSEEKIWDEREDKATYEYKGNANITNLEEALAFSKVDLSVWEVERHVFNTWTTTVKSGSEWNADHTNGKTKGVSKAEVVQKWNVQVKVWFRKKQTNAVEAALLKLEERLSKYSFPVFKSVRPNSKTNHCAVLNLYDAHIDKVAYAKDHGGLEENLRVFQTLFDRMLTSCLPYNPEEIIIPVGHDFFHTNGPENRTKKAGHLLDVNILHEDSFVIGTEQLFNCIDKAAQVAKVKAILIRANHSEDKDFYLGQVMKAFYRNSPDVEIDHSKDQRKYHQYGNCMMAFAHGDKEKGKTVQLPLKMAVEKKNMWAETTHRTFYLGDIHHKQEYQFLRTQDYPGVEVRFLRSVGTDDKWHVDNGYVGIPKTAECHIWHKLDGLAATFLANR